MDCREQGLLSSTVTVGKPVDAQITYKLTETASKLKNTNAGNADDNKMVSSPKSQAKFLEILILS